MIPAIDSDDLGTLCVCAVRYALGRQSYVTGLIARIVTDHRRHLSANDVQVILRDVHEAERIGGLGSECDARAWLKMANALRAPSPETDPAAPAATKHTCACGAVDEASGYVWPGDGRGGYAHHPDGCAAAPGSKGGAGA